MKGFDLYQKLNLNINPADLDKVLFHSSYLSQTENDRKRNKVLIYIGRNLLTSFIYVYFCIKNTHNNVFEINNNTNIISSNIVKEIYDKYCMSEYIYYSKGEQGKKYYDVVLAIIALLYKENGYIYTFMYLSDFIKKYENVKKYDYRTILQEYVQSKKIPCEYKVLSMEGPSNEPIIKCELRVGKNVIVAKGNSKKKAYTNAAKQYIFEHNIPLKQIRQKKKVYQHKHKYKILPKREKQLLEFYNDLHISKNELSLEYMNAPFIHNTYLNENHGVEIIDNELISMVGSEMLHVFAVEYIVETSSVNYLDMMSERNSLLKSDNLISGLPNNLLTLLVAGKGMKNDTFETTQRAKFDIFKGIIGALIVNGTKISNKKSIISAQEFSYYIFDNIKREKRYDYSTNLVRAAQKLQLECNEKYTSEFFAQTNSYKYRAHLKYYNDFKSYYAVGEGSNKKQARNSASFEILNLIIKDYSDDKLISKMIYEVLDRSKYIELLENSWEIKKFICKLNNENKCFVTIHKPGVKDLYDLGFWKKKVRQNGISFTAPETKQLFDIISKFTTIEKKEFEQIDDSDEISDYYELSKEELNDFLTGTNKNVPSLTDERKIDIIRSEILKGNQFADYISCSEKLLPHQKAACRIADLFNKFAFFYDTGTGKTVLALDIMLKKEVRNKAKFLIICPKSIIQTAWMDDQEKFYPGIRLLPLSQNITLDNYLKINNRWNILDSRTTFNDYLYYDNWQKGTKSNQLKYVKSVLLGKAKHFIINPESFIRNIDFFRSLGINGLIVDESSILKNYDSKISKSVRNFAEECKYVYLLSGKPAPNHTMEYFSQMKIIAPDDFCMSYNTFKKTYYKNELGKITFLNKTAKEKVTNLISKHSIVVSKEDCIKLPPTVHMVRKVTLDSQVMDMYKTMYYDYFVDIQRKEQENKDKKIIYNVHNKLASLMKLRQLVSGFITKEETVTDIHDKKILELINVLNEIGDEQVVIWCQFKYEIVKLKKILEKKGKTVVTAYSGTKDKDKSIKLFKERKADIIIAHPKTLQYGVTFTNCRYAIYYSLSYSFEEYYQSHDRIYRYGQSNSCTFIFIQAENTIDEVLFKCIQEKKDDAVIFEMLIKDASEHNVFRKKDANEKGYRN